MSEGKPESVESLDYTFRNAALAVLALGGGALAVLGLIHLLHRANDPMRRVNRLLDLCYRKISRLESTLDRQERPLPES